jgi:hypothetical protein
MIRGDGSNSNGRYDFTTTSENLWNFVQLSLLRLQIPFSVLKSPEETDSSGVHRRESFTIRVTDIEAMNRIIHAAQRIVRIRKKYNVSRFRGAYFSYPVRQVSQIHYSGEVRNLEVEGANSYVLQGGSVHNCLPKDLNALLKTAEKRGVNLRVARATAEGNRNQAGVAVQLAERLVGDLHGKRIALLGLAFKPGSDDMREAVSLKLIPKLIRRGAEVVAYDPVAIENARRILGDKVEYAKSARECLTGADCCILVTEWTEFSGLHPGLFGRLMRTPAVVDGRRVFERNLFFKSGVKFAAVGLGPAPTPDND